MTKTIPEKSSLLDLLGKLAALASSGIVIASLSYDWGFFHAINLSFSDLPTSVTDHIRSALDWAPQLTGAAAVYLVLDLLTRRIEGGRTEGRKPKLLHLRRIRRN
ncbi:hypothetical protein [Paraburkholderia sp. C35]|uniref:hypothetical protein n=1 Tax=Paraburkholderia sp. C35 TaxID=2126993 RepID=UPI0013A59554|nr:hypothetical protein [Paraburkholderia sp. C35]